MSRQLWQIAAGEDGRRYDDLFRKYDVMFLGPGYPGEYQAETYQRAELAREITKDERERVARFCTEVRQGDFVLARRGTRIVEIGVVHNDAVRHDSTFDDVHGWEVQHSRRVRWITVDASVLSDLEGTLSFHRPKTFTRADGRMIAKLEPLFVGTERELNNLPAEIPMPLSVENLSSELYSRGIPFDQVNRVTTAISRVRALVEWYGHTQFDVNRPTEHEVVAHLILPILLALGWSEQQLAIEWGRRDLAAFLNAPMNKITCALVVEAKGMGHGLQGVYEQARAYTSDLPNCRKLLITNGVRNYVYERSIGGDWQSEPKHYFNLLRLRTNHLCHPNTNAVDGIVALRPGHDAR